MAMENEVGQVPEEVPEEVADSEPAQIGLFDIQDYEVFFPLTVPSEERMQDIALNAIGKIPLQDLINDAVSALVELYKAKPDICKLDLDNYGYYPPLVANPFMDLVACLKELNHGREH